MSSTEQKLGKIFPEPFQVKRLMKQIEDLKQLREKGTFDIRMILVKSQCITFKVQIGVSAFKNTKLPQTIRVAQDYKIVVRSNYPAYPPKLFFTHNNMSRFNLRPFRDYMPQLLTLIGQWSAKTTIQQIIKSVPTLLQQMYVQKPSLQKYPSIQQYFQLDNMYSWKFCQVFPIKLIKKTGSKQAYMFVDSTAGKAEIVFLEDVGLEASFMTCDYVKGAEIMTLRKKKNTTNQFLLELRLSYKGISGKYAIEFSAQDSQNILISIMDCARAGQPQRKISQSQIKNEQSSSSEESQGQQQNQKKEKVSTTADRPLKINQIIEQIIIYESLVDSGMTSQNLGQLVTLLQKAIEYYSAANDERYCNYLNKLQNILANEMAQALLQSSSLAKSTNKGSKSQSKQQAVSNQYESIIDLI